MGILQYPPIGYKTQYQLGNNEHRGHVTI